MHAYDVPLGASDLAEPRKAAGYNCATFDKVFSPGERTFDYLAAAGFAPLICSYLKMFLHVGKLECRLHLQSRSIKDSAVYMFEVVAGGSCPNGAVLLILGPSCTSYIDEELYQCSWSCSSRVRTRVQHNNFSVAW